MSGPTYPSGYPGDPNSQPGYPQYPQPQQPPYSQPPAYQPPAYQPPYSQLPAQPPKKGGGSTVFVIIGIILAVLVVACVGLCFALDLGARFAGTALSTTASQIGTSVATQASTYETQASSAAPLQTVTSFCQAESSQDYTSAYQELSPTLQQQYSQSQFTQDGQSHDSHLGPITDCAPGSGATINGASASVNIAVTRTPPTPTGGTGPSVPKLFAGQITLTQNTNGSWVINSVDSTLNLL